MLARQPVALAVLVGDHIAATRSGLRAAVGGLRARLSGVVPAQAVEELVTALLAQEAVLARIAREIEQVGSALRAASTGHDDRA